MEPAPPPFSPSTRPRSYRALSVALIVAVFFGCLILTGAIRSTTGPAAGAAIHGAPTSIPATTRPILRIATFNIHSGIGADNRRDLDRVAQLLRGFDIVGLNEVRGPGLFGGADQAQKLGGKTALPYLYAPAERQWWHDSFGNAVLCKVPVLEWRRTPLPRSSGRGYKNLLHLRASVAGREVHVLITHVDRQTDREVQLYHIFEQFAALPAPAVLMGDFNTRPLDPLMKTIGRDPAGIKPKKAAASPAGVRAPTTQSAQFCDDPFADQNIDRVDWILLRGLKTRDSGIIQSVASDHPLLWVEVEVP